MVEIPKISQVSDAVATATTSTPKKAPEPVSIYTVKKGDSLSKIVAEQYGIDISTKQGKTKAHELAVKLAQDSDNSFVEKQTAEKKFHYKPTRSYNKTAPNLDLLKEGQKIKLGKIGDLKPKGYVEPKAETPAPIVSTGTEPDAPAKAVAQEDPSKKLGVPAGVTLAAEAAKADAAAAAAAVVPAPKTEPVAPSKTPLTYEPDKSPKALLKGGDKEVEIPQWKEPEALEKLESPLDRYLLKNQDKSYPAFTLPAEKLKPKTYDEVLAEFNDKIQGSPRGLVNGVDPKDVPGGDKAFSRRPSTNGKIVYVTQDYILGKETK